jgi:hypothetical protein
VSKVEITVSPIGTGSLTLDGHDISNAIRGFGLDARIGNRTQLRLDLCVDETHLTGEMDVRMNPAAAELLQRAGWTPPARPDVITFEPDVGVPCGTCKNTGEVEVAPYGVGPCPDCSGANKLVPATA